MKLKSLFFPAVLIICVGIFFGWIWPEINSLMEANQQKKDNIQALEDVEKKKADINALGNKISSDIEQKKVIENYLPVENVEERIIGGINYLADDAGVSLMDVSMNKKAVDAVASTSLNNQVTGNETGVAATSQVSRLKFNETTITASGEYEKLGLFVDKIQKIALFNSIKELTITKKADLNAAAVSTGGADQSANSKNLQAKIVVKFGYLPVTNYSENQISKLSSRVDDEAINAFKFYISGKDVSVISETGAAGIIGKKNPFFLE